MLVPRPSGRADRQVTRPLTSSDGCKQAVHESARDSLVCRGGHPAEDLGCVMWYAAATRVRSARVVGRHRVTDGSGVTLYLRAGTAGARHRAERSSVTSQRPCHKNTKADTYTTRKECMFASRAARQTPHRLRARQRIRTSHPHGFTHSLTHYLTAATAPVKATATATGYWRPPRETHRRREPDTFTYGSPCYFRRCQPHNVPLLHPA